MVILWALTPLFYIVIYFKGTFSTNYALMTAGCVILIVPQLTIFTIFQRYIIDGVTAGAVKG